MVSRPESIAHVLRRATFGPNPGQVETWLDAGPDELIDTLLDDEGWALSDDEVDAQLPGEEYDDLPKWWVERLVGRDALLHERMTWFWHNHFTSSVDRSPTNLMWRQHHTLRRHALGNFRDLAQEVTVSGAMLYWLDGSGSTGEAPNENHGRELMELMTIGPGNYTEDDVRVAARGMSGWYVDYDTGDVSFDPDSHYSGPLTFLGLRERWTTDRIVDVLCDQEACAPFVAGRLHQYLAGTTPSDDVRSELAAVFRDNDLEIRPLVEAILRSSSFAESVHARPRQPIEWVSGALRALQYTPVDGEEQWWLESLGQLPFFPPNVAGWPYDQRWVAASQVLTKGNIVAGMTFPTELEDTVEPTVDAVLARCGLYDVSDQTRAVLDSVVQQVPEFDGRLRMLLILTLTSPEFSLI